MKLGTWISLGVMVAGPTYGPSSLEAQPSSEPIPTDARPVQAAGQPVPLGDEAIVTYDPDMPWNQHTSVEARKAARALFLEGNRLFMIPLFTRATEQYAAALKQWKHPAIHYNLALAQLNLGQEVEARENLEQALKHGDAPLGEKRFQEARQRLDEVTRHLGRIHVTCRTQGAQVTLNGVPLFIGPGSYQGWVQAKDHELTAKKSGYLSEARRVTIAPESVEGVELKLVTLSEATDANRRWAAWKPWAVVVAGGTIAAAGGVFHALAAQNFNDYDKEFVGLTCAADPSRHGCTKDEIPSSLNNRLALARQQQSIAIGSYIAGGSMIVAGVVLLYLNRPHLAEQENAGRFARNTIIIPTISSDTIGVLVSATP